MRGELDKIIDEKKLLLPILTEIQDREGYISEETVREVAKKIGIPMSKIFGAATFYSFLTTKPQGKYVIHICNSPSCYVNGSMNLIKVIEKELGIKSGETTDDGLFTLHIGSCIGCCDNAPAMLINDKEHFNLNKKKVKEILDRCRS